MRVQQRAIEKIDESPGNPRHITDDAVAAVAQSIQKFGFNQPVTVDKNGVLIAGHTRLRAAKLLGLKTIPCETATELNETEAAAYRIVDNRTGELAEWNHEKLAAEVESIENAAENLAPAFNIDAVEAIIAAASTNQNATAVDDIDGSARGVNQQLNTCPTCGFQF